MASEADILSATQATAHGVPPETIVLLFNARNQVWVEGAGSAADPWRPSWRGSVVDEARLAAVIRSIWSEEVVVRFAFELGGADPAAIYWGRLNHRLEETPLPSPDGQWVALETIRLRLETEPETLDPHWTTLCPAVRWRAIEIPYLNFGPNEFIYRFRTDKQRNREVYQNDEASRALYQSRLCGAIKGLRRLKENRSGEPAVLDFGPVVYVLPSHFGFCLGVQNAIERAYEVIAAYPGRRVFMLSELIHNPFVNEDLHRRGLRYLQTDKGKPVLDPEKGTPYWESLTAEDIVIIPAFGATNEDKVRLIEKGLALNEFDATCMLVEKVWKAARRFATEGHTVIIHGKAEHEETKATFSNTARYGAALVLRNFEEARHLGAIIREADPARKRALLETHFAGKFTDGFDPNRDLRKIAVVNQTTLLRNETMRIIEFLESVMEEKFGAEVAGEHIHPQSRGDTLCYATQVNQDALGKALDGPLDLALIAGGTNSSNTYQLYRVCADRLGNRAAYIQSETNLIAPGRVRHYHFAHDPKDPLAGKFEERDYAIPSDRPMRILITGGASCPDGVIQQIINRCNSFFPAESLRTIDEVRAEIEAEGGRI